MINQIELRDISKESLKLIDETINKYNELLSSTDHSDQDSWSKSTTILAAMHHLRLNFNKLNENSSCPVYQILKTTINKENSFVYGKAFQDFQKVQDLYNQISLQFLQDHTFPNEQKLVNQISEYLS